MTFKLNLIFTQRINSEKKHASKIAYDFMIPCTSFLFFHFKVPVAESITLKGYSFQSMRSQSYMVSFLSLNFFFWLNADNSDASSFKCAYISGGSIINQGFLPSFSNCS